MTGIKEELLRVAYSHPIGPTTKLSLEHSIISIKKLRIRRILFPKYVGTGQGANILEISEMKITL